MGTDQETEHLTFVTENTGLLVKLQEFVKIMESGLERHQPVNVKVSIQCYNKMIPHVSVW